MENNANFFNPYNLVKSKKNDKDNLIARLKKQQDATKIRPSNNAMDIEKPQVVSRTKMDIEIPQKDIEKSGRKIVKLTRAFMERRRIMKRYLAELTKKINDFETLLLKMPTIREKQFLKDSKLIEMLRLVGVVWISGLKYLCMNQSQGIKRKRKNTEEIRSTAMSKVFKLNDLIILSFDKKLGKSSLLLYLLEDTMETKVCLLLILSLISYTKMLKKIDSTIDFITSSPWKKAIHIFYFSLFDTEQLIISMRYIRLDGDKLELSKLLYEEGLVKTGLQKLMSTAFISFIKTGATDNNLMCKGFMLSSFTSYFFTKLISKSDPSFSSSSSTSSKLITSLETCFSYPLVGDIFINLLLKDQKIGPTFSELIEQIPGEPLSNYPPVHPDSKLNFCINMMYMLPYFLEDQNTQEAYKFVTRALCVLSLTSSTATWRST